MQTEIITEGTTKIEVPILDSRANYPPSSARVFYNPKMELNRDISIACISALKKKDLTYVDVLAATGIRGIRVANEIGLEVTINDWNPYAYELIKKNIKLNNLLKANCTKKNANILLHEKHFDIVDIDPFGSPVPFLDSACRSVNHMLSVTATDTAPLCGAHKNAGIRKYFAIPLKTEYHPEIGIRILLGVIARELAKYNKSMKPLLSFAIEHYFRVYLQIISGAKITDKTIRENIGYIGHCFKCGFRTIITWLKNSFFYMEKKCNCGKEMDLAGPLWIGKLHDKTFCDRVLQELENRTLGKKKKAIKIVSTIIQELDIPTYYDHHIICKKLKISPTPIDIVIKELQNKGFKASRTHFSGTSFKTEALIEEIKDIMKSIQ